MRRSATSRRNRSRKSWGRCWPSSENADKTATRQSPLAAGSSAGSGRNSKSGRTNVGNAGWHGKTESPAQDQRRRGAGDYLTWAGDAGGSRWCCTRSGRSCAALGLLGRRGAARQTAGCLLTAERRRRLMLTDRASPRRSPVGRGALLGTAWARRRRVRKAPAPAARRGRTAADPRAPRAATGESRRRSRGVGAGVAAAR